MVGSSSAASARSSTRRRANRPAKVEPPRLRRNPLPPAEPGLVAVIEPAGTALLPRLLHPSGSLRRRPRRRLALGGRLRRGRPRVAPGPGGQSRGRPTHKFTVRLHFAEVDEEVKPGQRVFNVSLQAKCSVTSTCCELPAVRWWPWLASSGESTSRTCCKLASHPEPQRAHGAVRHRAGCRRRLTRIIQEQVAVFQTARENGQLRLSK